MKYTSLNFLRRGSAILLVALLLTAGCREKEPTPMLMQDLGDGERVLLPVSSPWHEVPYNRGDTAQWVEFRPPDPDELPAFGKEAAGAQMAINRVKELIDRYESLADARDAEGLLALHTEDLRESLAPMLELGFEMVEKLETIEGILLEELPDEDERIENLFSGMMEQSNQLVRDREALTVVSADEITAPSTPASLVPTVHFVKRDGAWFVHYPNLPDMSAMMPMLKQQAGALDMAIQGIKSGAVPAAQILRQMETMVRAMEMMQGRTPSTPGDGDGTQEEEVVELEEDDE